MTEPAPTDAQSIIAATVDAIGQAVIATDTRGRVSCWNSSAEQLYGYSKDEALGRTIGSLIATHGDVAAAAAARESLRGGESYAGDWQVRDKSGRALTVFVTCDPVRDSDGKVLGLVALSRDVSERRDAERRAIAGSLVVEHSPNAVIQMDAGGIITLANPASESVFGYPPDVLVGQPVSILIPPDRLHELSTVTRAAETGEMIAPLVTKRLHRDGSVFDALAHLGAVRDDEGHLVAITAIVTDITDLVHVRRELELREQMFRARFEQLPIPQASVALNGCILEVNDALCALIGYSREELVGRRVGEFQPAADRRRAATLATRFRKGEVCTWERTFVRPDGRHIPVVISGALVQRSEGDDFIAVMIQDLTLLDDTRRTLAQREALFALLNRRASEWTLVLDAGDKITYVSPSVTDALGYGPQDLLGRNPRDYVHPDDRAKVGGAVELARGEPGAESRVTFRVRDSRNRWRWVDDVIVNDAEGPMPGVVLYGRDITEQVEAEVALRTSESRFRAIAECAGEGIWVVRRDGQSLFANDRLKAVLGRDMAAEGVTAAQVLDPEGDTRLGQLIVDAAGVPTELELAYRKPCGEMRTLKVRATSIPLDDDASGCVLMVDDVTDVRAAEQQLRRQALHDSLTGVANRTLLEDRLTQAVTRSRRAGSRIAVLFADLDQFKLVNDTYGHGTGDELLRQAAQRLAGLCRDADTLARFGGDEFVIVAEDTDSADAHELAARVQGALADPFIVNDQRLYLTASVGIAMSTVDSAEDLLRRADTAMYAAKRQGRGRIQMFHPELATRTAEWLSLASDLRDALAHDRMTLHYQPVVELATGRILGVEALARWSDASRGNVPPTTFVKVAESVGLGRTLDDWVLTRVCHDLPRLRRLLGSEARVAVNISAAHLSDANFARHVVDIVSQALVGGRSLTIEITETAMMSDPERAQRVVDELRRHDMHVAIDDFGTGYSSLAWLSRLRVDRLKIDASFVEHVTEDADALAIASSIIDLARTVHVQTIAEGVETPEQATLLHRLGCDAAQGHLWAPALPLEQLEATVAGLLQGRFVAASAVGDATQSADVVTAEHGLNELLRLHRSGASPTSIAAALNGAGFRTPRGTSWHRISVSRAIGEAAHQLL